MTDDDLPLDLEALDPTLPLSAFERRLSGIRLGTAVGLRRRRETRSPFGVVARWRAPLLAAAALIMVMSSAWRTVTGGDAAVSSVTASDVATAEAPDELADALGLSTTLGSALLSDTTSAETILLGGYWP